ncbi:hypothetical protein [Halorussus amylolyticus]|uniref:hypothetical protein n=1 Tax=Halorussus amylolyticus TaxID=1126242 RepID=UPI00104D22A1|nr:hypothetical protein [Halorussus amylolyticus]
MVGPPTSEENRGARNLLWGSIVALVGVSAGLVTLSTGGTLVEIGVAIVVGLAIGAALLAYLIRIAV